jgi:biopolymer transport protein ExbB/biopolymer transport protein TolQ
MMGLGVQGIGVVAVSVILVLLAMSIVSMAIVAERWWLFRQAAHQTRRYASDLPGLLGRGALAEAIAASQRPEVRLSPLAGLAEAGLQEWSTLRASGAVERDRDRSLEAIRQALEFASLVRVADLRRGLSVLATIGATAPFVGLFGTTFGIINAFRAIAITGSTNMAVISSGVSEALITTAFGLVVAVPAVWAYNAFLGRVQSFQVELDRGRYVLLSYLDRVSE